MGKVLAITRRDVTCEQYVARASARNSATTARQMALAAQASQASGWAKLKAYLNEEIA